MGVWTSEFHAPLYLFFTEVLVYKLSSAAGKTLHFSGATFMGKECIGPGRHAHALRTPSFVDDVYAVTNYTLAHERDRQMVHPRVPGTLL